MATANSRLSTGVAYINALTVASVNDSTPPYPGLVGQFYEKAGIKYQYVQFKATTTTIANGTPVLWSDKDDFVVSAKISDSVRGAPAGIALGTVTAGNYAFIQVRGNHPTVLTNGDDDIAAGDSIIMGAADGVVDSTAAGTAPTYATFGIASAADVDANNTVAVDLTVPLNGI